MIAAAAVVGRRRVRGLSAPHANAVRYSNALGSKRVRLMCALGGGCSCDGSPELGVGAVAFCERRCGAQWRGGA